MPELPGGTLTILHTDVEKSTPLTVYLGDRYPEVLTTHHKLLRAAFAAHEGREVDTQGDSFSWFSLAPRRRLPRPWRFNASPGSPNYALQAGALHAALSGAFDALSKQTCEGYEEPTPSRPRAAAPEQHRVRSTPGP